MQKLIIQIVSFFFIAVTGLIYLAGCSKNEHPVEEARYTTLELKTFSTDSLQLKVLENDETLTDSLFAPDGIKNVSVQYFNPKHRIRLADAFTDRIWLDTMIDYKSGFINSITFYQPAANANFIWVGPPVNEPLPSKDYAKMSIRYTHANLPDLLKVIVENNPKGTHYEVTDSFELRKNEFSRYFLAYNASTKKVKLKLLSTDSKRKTIAYAEEGNFSSAVSADYNIYLFRTDGPGPGDSVRILGEKLY